MIINESNGRIIDTKDIYIHDDVLISLEFDRNNKRLILKLHKSADVSHEYTIVFSNVIGFEMSSCDFWGELECVLDFEYVEVCERVLIPRLQSERERIPNSEQNISLTDYIETLFTFSSGDKLRIACKTIEI